MSDNMETKNAEITRADIGIEGHGILTMELLFEYGCGSQGLPGYGMATNLGAHVERLLAVLGIESFSRVKGQRVRVRVSGGLICEVGHFTKDEWYCPETIAEANQ